MSEHQTYTEVDIKHLDDLNQFIGNYAAENKMTGLQVLATVGAFAKMLAETLGVTRYEMHNVQLPTSKGDA
jgi:hypothetical protein